jgi:hypothetical protein
MTVHEALDLAERKQLLVPGIQRDFEWSDNQICALFDSLMRGYPIGTLLFWALPPDAAKKWPWYPLASVVDRSRSAARRATKPGDGQIDAIVDGQQRLTALNIGVRGAIRRESGGAHDEILWFDATPPSGDPEPGQAAFEFMFDRQLPDYVNEPGEWWFRVPDVASLLGRREVRRLAGPDAPVEVIESLDRLRKAVRTDDSIVVQHLEGEDLLPVLNVFIKANTKGTALPPDDIMIAIATSVWPEARQVIAELRTDIEALYDIRISKTRLLKTAIVLTGGPRTQVGFQADNLTRARLNELRRNWPEVEQAIRVSCELLYSFGLTRKTLTAENAMIPIAIYAHHRKLDLGWHRHASRKADVERIRNFTHRSLVKKGFWTGAVDPVIKEARRVITAQNRSAGFPSAKLIETLSHLGASKNLRFTAAEIDDLLTMRYSERRCILLLGLLYPDMAGPKMDKDHIIPVSAFTKTAIRQAGMSPAVEYDRLKGKKEQLPNLCLLGQNVNRGLKGRSFPAEWLSKVELESPSQRRSLVRRLDLAYAPADLTEAQSFWAARARKLRKRLQLMLSDPS